MGAEITSRASENDHNVSVWGLAARLRHIRRVLVDEVHDLLDHILLGGQAERRVHKVGDCASHLFDRWMIEDEVLRDIERSLLSAVAGRRAQSTNDAVPQKGRIQTMKRLGQHLASPNVVERTCRIHVRRDPSLEGWCDRGSEKLHVLKASPRRLQASMTAEEQFLEHRCYRQLCHT